MSIRIRNNARTQIFPEEYHSIATWSVLFISPDTGINVVADHLTRKEDVTVFFLMHNLMGHFLISDKAQSLFQAHMCLFKPEKGKESGHLKVRSYCSFFFYLTNPAYKS